MGGRKAVRSDLLHCHTIGKYANVFQCDSRAGTQTFAHRRTVDWFDTDDGYVRAHCFDILGNSRDQPPSPHGDKNISDGWQLRDDFLPDSTLASDYERIVKWMNKNSLGFSYELLASFCCLRIAVAA